MRSRHQKEQATVAAASAEEALAVEGLAARQGEAASQTRNLEDQALPCLQGCEEKTLGRSR